MKACVTLHLPLLICAETMAPANYVVRLHVREFAHIEIHLARERNMTVTRLKCSEKKLEKILLRKKCIKRGNSSKKSFSIVHICPLTATQRRQKQRPADRFRGYHKFVSYHMDVLIVCLYIITSTGIEGADDVTFFIRYPWDQRFFNSGSASQPIH